MSHDGSEVLHDNAARPDEETGSHFSSDSSADGDIINAENGLAASEGQNCPQSSQQDSNNAASPQETSASRSRTLSWDEVASMSAPADWSDENADNDFFANLSGGSPTSQNEGGESDLVSGEQDDWPPEGDEVDHVMTTAEEEEDEETRLLNSPSRARVHDEKSKGYWYSARPRSTFGWRPDDDGMDLYRKDKDWHQMIMTPQGTDEKRARWKNLRTVADHLHLHTRPLGELAGSTPLRTMRLNLSPTLDAILDLDSVPAGLLSWRREEMQVPVSARPKFDLDKISGGLRFHLVTGTKDNTTSTETSTQRRNSEPSNPFQSWTSRLRARQEQAEQLKCLRQLKAELVEKTNLLRDSVYEKRQLQGSLREYAEYSKVLNDNIQYLQDRKNQYKDQWEKVKTDAQSWREEYQKQNPDAVAERVRRKRIEAGVPPEEYESALTQTDELVPELQRPALDSMDKSTQTENQAARIERTAEMEKLDEFEAINAELAQSSRTLQSEWKKLQRKLDSAVLVADIEIDKPNCSAAMRQLSECQKANKSLLAENEKFAADIEHLEDEKQQLRNSSRDIVQKLASSESQNHDLVVRSQTLERELAESRRACATLTTRLEGLRQETVSTNANGDDQDKDQLITALRTENNDYLRLLNQVKDLQLVASTATARIATPTPASPGQTTPGAFTSTPALPATPGIAVSGHLLTPSAPKTPAAPYPITPLTASDRDSLLDKPPRWLARERKFKNEQEWKRNRDAVLAKFEAREEAWRLEQEVRVAEVAA